jgi:hypothetical protein
MAVTASRRALWQLKCHRIYRNQDKEMQMRIGIGIAAVVAIGLIWSVAVMSEWVPVVSADAALGTRISATPPAVSVWVGPSGDGIMH